MNKVLGWVACISLAVGISIAYYQEHKSRNVLIDNGSQVVNIGTVLGEELTYRLAITNGGSEPQYLNLGSMKPKDGMRELMKIALGPAYSNNLVMQSEGVIHIQTYVTYSGTLSKAGRPIDTRTVTMLSGQTVQEILDSVGVAGEMVANKYKTEYSFLLK